MKLPLKECANGCGVPPCPPSLVICRKCMDKISETLKKMVASYGGDQQGETK